MCGAHRSNILTHIRQRLDARRNGSDITPLRIVSTQLVEAGVDLDVPVVYRALAGLEPQQALEAVLGRLKETQSNTEFLLLMQKSAPVGGHSNESDHR